MDLRRLQQVLEHTNINTTAVYLKFNDQDLQDLYANVPLKRSNLLTRAALCLFHTLQMNKQKKRWTHVLRPWLTGHRVHP